jgi:hypothetical protein
MMFLLVLFFSDDYCRFCKQPNLEILIDIDGWVKGKVEWFLPLSSASAFSPGSGRKVSD